jgi:hypothetical protein
MSITCNVGLWATSTHHRTLKTGYQNEQGDHRPYPGKMHSASRTVDRMLWRRAFHARARCNRTPSAYACRSKGGEAVWMLRRCASRRSSRYGRTSDADADGRKASEGGQLLRWQQLTLPVAGLFNRRSYVSGLNSSPGPPALLKTRK